MTAPQYPDERPEAEPADLPVEPQVVETPTMSPLAPGLDEQTQDQNDEPAADDTAAADNGDAGASDGKASPKADKSK